MANKKKRDQQANLEKDILLNPEKLKKRKRKKRKRILMMAGVELIVLIAVISVLFQVVRIVGKNSLLSRAETSPELIPIQAGDTLTEEEQHRWQEGWIKYRGRIYTYKEDILTFLVMGIDKNSDVQEVSEGTGGGQADALFLAVMDPDEKQIRIIGINRNTMADIDIYNEEGAYVTMAKAQIAVQHGFGNGMEESCERQVRAVSRLFYNLPIHGYAAINMSAVPAINDTVGGVEVKVLEDLSKEDSTLKKDEMVHLTGESALVYVRERNTNEFASADMRLQRQKQYLNAFIAAAKQTIQKDFSAALDLYRTISGQMVTDISIDEAAYLASMVADYRFEPESFLMLKGETVMGERFEEFYIDEDALYEMILDVFYKEVKNE